MINQAYNFIDNKILFNNKITQATSTLAKTNEDLIIHEMAHAISYQKFANYKELQAFDIELSSIRVKVIPDGDIYSADEAIAEAFILERKGKIDELTQEVKELLEKYINKWRK